MKHKKLIISLTAVCSVVIFLAIFLIVWFFGDTYKDFTKNFRQEFAIPGLDDGAVPQGLGNCSADYTITDEDGKKSVQTQQFYFTTAYMTDGSASRIYVTGAETGYLGYVPMKNVDGSDYTGHCGGIATNGDYLWVTGESTVYVAQSVSESKNIVQDLIEKAEFNTSVRENGKNVPDAFVTFTASFPANCNASFCFYYDDPTYTAKSYDRLYVGEFYRKGNYETDLSHRLTTPNGYENTAFAYEFNVSNTGKYGLTQLSATYPDVLDEENDVPEIKRILSIPEKIQGIARAGDMLVLSQSYGLANSHILCYDWNEIIGNTENKVNYKTLNGENFTYEGITKANGRPFTVTNTLYVYYIDNNNETQFLNDYSIPSMSEGLCAVNSRVYVLFESAGKKYNKFVRERVGYVYSLIPHAD